MKREPLSIITVDGPAASGKSSVSREVARAFGWNWVSTGAFYRGLALVAQKERIAYEDVKGLADLCSPANWSVLWSVEMGVEETTVLYRGDDVTHLIKDEQVGSLASRISPYPEVRAALLGLQRACAHQGSGLVAEGRDCGTVIFPQAPLKIFLTARDENRAQRRAQEQGKAVGDVLQAQVIRDHQDSSRKAAPMQVAPDGVVIDTSELNLQGVVNTVITHARRIFPQLEVIS